MANVDTILKDLDREVLATVRRGGSLSELPIADWQAFVPGFVQRNAVKARAERTRWLVAEKIYCAAWSLRWELPWLIQRSYTIFPYEQVQMHLAFVALLQRLEADSLIYLAAQESAKAEASQSVGAVPAVAKRYWDDWGDWVDNGVRQPSEWDIKRVNGIADELANLAAYLTLFTTETESAADPHDLAGVVAAALTEVQAFQAHFPAFCAVLNEANILDLTEKVIVKEPVELNIDLPTVTVADRSHTCRPLAPATAEGATATDATTFQGYFIGIVLEPRDENDRDLDNCWMSKEEIAKAYMHWSIHHQRVRVSHDPATEAGAFEHEHYRVVGNWLQFGDTVIGGYKVKDGTWLQSYQCMSEQSKSDVQNYAINSLSPGGMCNVWKDKKEAA